MQKFIEPSTITHKMKPTDNNKKRKREVVEADKPQKATKKSKIELLEEENESLKKQLADAQHKLSELESSVKAKEQVEQEEKILKQQQQQQQKEKEEETSSSSGPVDVMKSLNGALKKALNVLKLSSFTTTQQKLIPGLLKDTSKDVYVQASSGRLLASVITVLNEMIKSSIESGTQLDQPSIHSIILTAKTETAMQMTSTAQSILTRLGSKLKSKKQLFAVHMDGSEESVNRLKSDQGLTLLISTPEQLDNNNHSVNISNVKILVIEDVSELAEEKERLTLITNRVPSSTRMIVMSSTTDEEGKSLLKKGSKSIIVPDSQYQLPKLRTLLVDNSKRMATLLSIVKRNIKTRKVIIYAALKYTVKFIGKILTSENIKHEAISGKENQKARRQSFHTFCNDPEIKVFVVSEFAAQDHLILQKGEDHLAIQFELPLDNLSTHVNHLIQHEKSGQVVIMLTRNEMQAAVGAFRQQYQKQLGGDIPNILFTTDMDAICGGNGDSGDDSSSNEVDACAERIVQLAKSKKDVEHLGRNIVRSYSGQIHKLFLKQYKLLPTVCPVEEYVESFGLQPLFTSGEEIGKELQQQQQQKQKQEE